MAEQNPKVKRRCQSALVFTSSDGRTVSSCNAASPQKSVKKMRILSQPKQPRTPQPSSVAQRDATLPYPCQHPLLPKTDPRILSSYFNSPARYSITPIKPPRSLNFATENLLVQTPSMSQQKCPLPSSTKRIKIRAAMTLKALEDERLEASRYEQDRGDLDIKAQEKAYTAWLNQVLLEPVTPKQSTCDSELETGSVVSNESSRLSSFSDFSHFPSDSLLNTVIEGIPASKFSASPAGSRTLMTQRRSIHTKAFTGKQAKDGLQLDASLQAICSIRVLRSRLEPFLDAKTREAVISTITSVAKHIDEGRLKMKSGCAILTDVALKENLIEAMLNYNTPWLKIGLYVVLGHSALLLQGSAAENTTMLDEDKEAQHTVLRLIIKKHFLSHAGLAKSHATNKKIEGLYKQGYHEALARVILKRLLLLVLVLDNAKCQRTLPLACGVDGIDGGSPLLFHKNGNIKSSRHALQEFLLNAMHGEGDVVGHLGVLGYHVAHSQAGLADYNFEITNLIEDLKDGICLCRLVQVLLGDMSILVKVKIPSDRTRQRNHNCGIALEHLARAGVSLVDAFGCPITPEDLVEGDQQRVFALLWNIMLSLQIPILVNNAKLGQEIAHIEASDLHFTGRTSELSVMKLLLIWVQVICMKVDYVVEEFATSFADGQALCHLINFYYPMLLPQSVIQSSRPPLDSLSPGTCRTQLSCHNIAEMKVVAANNLASFQFAIRRLGSIPEVLQPSHFVEENPFVCDKSIMIMLAFLYHRLVEAKPQLEEKMDALSWHGGLDITELRQENLLQAASSCSDEELLGTTDIAAMTTQKTIEGVLQHHDISRMTAAIVIQDAVRKWLALRHELSQRNSAAMVIQAQFRKWVWRCKCNLDAVQSHGVHMGQEEACMRIQRSWKRYSAKKRIHSVVFAVVRIQSWWRKWQLRKIFMEKRAAAILIQSHLRSYLERRHFQKLRKGAVKLQALVRGRYAQRTFWKYKAAAVQIQRLWRGALTRSSFSRKRDAAIFIQRRWRGVLAARYAKIKETDAATIIQRHWRGVLTRLSISRKANAATLIQQMWRGVLVARHVKMKQIHAATTIKTHWRDFSARKRHIREEKAAIIIQSCARGYLARKLYAKSRKRIVKLQGLVKGWCQRKSHCRLVESARIIESWWRQVLAKRQHQAQVVFKVVKIQASWRRFSMRRTFLQLKDATVHIQSWMRRYICRARYTKLRGTVIKMQAFVRSKQSRIEYLYFRVCVVKVQAIFRSRKQQKLYKLFQYIITRLQAHFRGRIERQRFITCKNAAIMIQRHFRRYWHHKTLICSRQFVSAIRIQLAWKSKKLHRAAAMIQAQYRVWRQKHSGSIHKRKVAWCGVPSVDVETSNLSPLLEETLENSLEVDHGNDTLGSQEMVFYLQISAIRLQRWWRCVSNYRHNAATIIQKHFRGWQKRGVYQKKRSDIIIIQAVWRGFLVRHKHDYLKEELSALRHRMQSTAATVDKKMRLEYRLTEALAALLSQKTVSGILHTCATIDLATQHSKLCCERLLEAGAIPKLLQLIQTTNRSPPHEEILKHSLSILGNLARYPTFAARIANARGSITIVADQILRNNEEVIVKVLRVLQLVCKVPIGLDAVRKNFVVLKRLNNLSQILEKKVETEARALARLPQTAVSIVARRGGEKKVSDVVALHHTVVALLQVVTGEDLHMRLKAVRRLSSMCMAPSAAAGCRLSMSRFPLQDCSNH